MRKLMVCGMLCFCTFLLCGCWDRVELEERRFVLGVGIDYIPPGQEAKPGEKEYTQPSKEGRSDHRVTYGMAKLGGKEQGGDAKSGKKNEMDFLTTESALVFGTARMALVRQDKKLFFEHIKTIVIGEEEAKTDISEPLDFLARDPEMRRRMRVVVCQGKAEDYLKIVPMGDAELPIVIANMLRARGATRVNPEADLGNILEKMHRGEAFDVPYMINAEGELRIFGSAVFKNNSMTATLDELETIGLNWLRGTIRGGLIGVEMEMDGQPNTVVLEVRTTKTKRNIQIDEQGNIVYVVKVKILGSIGENQLKADTLTPEFLEKMSKEISRQIEKGMIKTHRKLTDLNTDVAGVGRLTYQQHPKVWKKIGSQWDEFFPTVKVQVKVETKITRVGLVRN